MKLFNRKPKTTQIPTELEPYYSNQSGWRVWARRVLTVIVIIAVLFALVWAARAVYRQITDNDTGTSNETSQTERDKSKSDNADSNSDDTARDKNSSQTEGESSAGGASESTNEGQDSGSSNMPRTGDDPTDEPAPQTVLPATGG